MFVQNRDFYVFRNSIQPAGVFFASSSCTVSLDTSEDTAQFLLCADTFLYLNIGLQLQQKYAQWKLLENLSEAFEASRTE